MRISKRTREQAAQLCSMRATDEAADVSLAIPTRAIRALFSRHVAKLAWAAFSFACDNDDPGGAFLTEEWWAEAEALLRSGWSPGDLS